MEQEIKSINNKTDLQKNYEFVGNSRNIAGVYSADIPLENPSLDRFERFVFAQKIAKAIAERKNPSGMIMGVNGSPGEGKTTILNFIQKELSNYKGTTVVRFNPWRYQNEFQIIKVFFSNLSRATQISEDNTSDIFPVQLFENYANLLVYGSNTASPKSKSFRQNNFSDIESVRKNIEHEFLRRRKHIIFLIDDLDKLEKSHIKTVFKLIRLNASFSHVTYVLAFDENIIVKVLDESNTNDKLNSGKKLLEKVVQISIKLPHFNSIALQEFCLESINDLLSENNIRLEEDQKKVLLNILKNGFTGKIKSVRLVKQYRNFLSFSLPEVKNQVDIIEFLLIEGIRAFYPTVHETIKRSSFLFQSADVNSTSYSKRSEDFLTEVIEKMLEPFEQYEKKAIEYLLSFLFPAVRRLGQGKNILDYFFNLLEYEDSHVIKAKVDELFNSYGASNLVNALKSKAQVLSEEISTKLISTLGISGEYFANPDTLFSFLTANSHPALLIRDLLRKISDPTKRFNTAKDLITESAPLSFAFECYRWMCTIENEEEEDRLFDTFAEKELGRIIEQRISDFAEREPLYISTPEETPFLLSTWSYLSGKETTGNYLVKSFKEAKDNIIYFLKCYLPVSDAQHPISKEDMILGLDQFIYITNVIEPKDVFTSLLDNIGEEFLIDNVGGSGFSERISQRFAKTYKSFNFLNSLGTGLEEAEPLRKEIISDNRRKVTAVKKGIYRPLA